MKIIVVGGDAAGMSAAAKLKRVREDCQITVYEKGAYLSYAACGLPYYVAYGEITKQQLIQRTREQFEQAGISPFPLHEVTKVIPERRAVRVTDLRTGREFEDTYDKLLIATGAYPLVPDVPGAALEGVGNLKTVDDGVWLKQELAQGAQTITIIGGGYIGVEAAETLASAGKKVRVIQRADTILRNFDASISHFAHQELTRMGVEIKTKENLEAILGTSRARTVVTDAGSYETDVVLLAIGVLPATQFLQGSGIELAGNGAVVVDREMRTSLPDIYSAGDCAQIYHLLKGENTYIPLATTANKCGRIVGENLAGHHVSFPGTLGSSGIKVGEIELARTGLSEHEADAMGVDWDTVMVKASDLPHYYPGSAPVHFKLIYEKDSGRILGVQGAGQKGVVLRMNVFACAIANRMTTDELGMLDLCYAPPFSTPWDAIHITANAASGRQRPDGAKTARG